MIEVEGLTKYYGRLAAIKDVSFRVESGEIVGFLGPNGAGKSTTMRILTCFTPASSGEARIEGMDVRDQSLAIREKVGYLPENVPIYPWMRVDGYLDFVARAKGIASSERGQEILRVSRSTGIAEVRHKLIYALSKGYRQRVGLAQALIGNPPILVLDEPTIGLDPRQIREIRELIKGFAKDRTVILSTHILPEVSHVCNRVIIINKGTIVAEDTPDNLARRHRKSSVTRLVVRAPEDDVRRRLTGLAGVASVQNAWSGAADEVRLLVESAPEAEVRAQVAKLIVQEGWELLELTPVDVSLEDVFIDLVTEEPSTESDTRTEEVA